jgi:D-tyrosyl-tRNA(Tyr) deacylase
MRAVIQRVRKASVHISGKLKSQIAAGLLILLGIEDSDTYNDAKWLAAKISKLRIFDDAQGRMNLSLQDVGGEVLIVSQFTLHASTKKGNRPSYIRAAHPDIAIPLYEGFIAEMVKITAKPVRTGEFGAHMQIELLNDGPVTLIIDTKNKE